MKIYILVKSWERSDGEGGNDILTISANHDEVRRDMKDDYVYCLENPRWEIDQDASFCSNCFACAVEKSETEKIVRRWSIYSWTLND